MCTGIKLEFLIVEVSGYSISPLILPMGRYNSCRRGTKNTKPIIQLGSNASLDSGRLLITKGIRIEKVDFYLLITICLRSSTGNYKGYGR